jgi:hypothetical protein
MKNKYDMLSEYRQAVIGPDLSIDEKLAPGAYMFEAGSLKKTGPAQVPLNEFWVDHLKSDTGYLYMFQKGPIGFHNDYINHKYVATLRIYGEKSLLPFNYFAIDTTFDMSEGPGKDFIDYLEGRGVTWMPLSPEYYYEKNISSLAMDMLKDKMMMLEKIDNHFSTYKDNRNNIMGWYEARIDMRKEPVSISICGILESLQETDLRMPAQKSESSK